MCGVIFFFQEDSGWVGPFLQVATGRVVVGFGWCNFQLVISGMVPISVTIHTGRPLG